MKHENGYSCESCLDKLRQGHPEISRLYRQIIAIFPDCHVSWCFRNEKDQNDLFASGKSKLAWPKSAHNKMVGEEPCALAIDLFQLADGKASFPVAYYRSIWDFLKRRGEAVIWGGNFPTFKDYDHFQISIDAE